ncbi:hypothetical protein [Algiphilus sp.]|uniref:hypothetical protein n=1 Tax=Algiphilus sp. TaxID=1872431 RepID=UPI0025BE580B|nr:hypothetical protein [Algiphilus sp.]MCK5769585.1 hypothetical protein [Algiphilus sp.]
MRALIDLPDKERAALEVVRRAVALYIAEHRSNQGSPFGIRRDRADDALAAEDRLRDEWRGR